MYCRWVSRSIRRGLAILGWALASGCAGRAQPVPLAPDTLPDHDQVEVWSRNGHMTLHALRISADTVSGVPYWQPSACDTCRVEFPLSQVDSLTPSNREAGGIFLGLTPFIAMFAIAIAMAIGYGPD